MGAVATCGSVAPFQGGGYGPRSWCLDRRPGPRHIRGGARQQPLQRPERLGGGKSEALPGHELLGGGEPVEGVGGAAGIDLAHQVGPLVDGGHHRPASAWAYLA